MNYRALLVDFDGTLVGADFRVSKRLMAAAHRLDPTVHFGIVSGRPYDRLVERASVDLGLTGPHVLQAGARILDPKTNTTLWQATLPPKLVSQVVALLQETTHDFFLEDTLDVYVGRANESLFTTAPESSLASIRDRPDRPVLKIFARTGPRIEDATQLKQTILTAIPDVRAVEWYHGHLGRGGVDIAMATKLEGVVRWLEITDIDRSALIGVGDGRNDFPLFTASGHKIAMGNSDPELVAAADEIAPTLAEDGLAWVIEKYFLNQ